MYVIYWLRQDLRVEDNPALASASSDQKTVLPIYIYDNVNQSPAMGSASKAWLHHALIALEAQMGHKILCLTGDPWTLITQPPLKTIIERYNIQSIYWNRCYEPWRMARDEALKSKLTTIGITAHSFNGSLLWEPWTVKKDNQEPYKVFTPFFRKGCLPQSPRALVSPIKSIDYLSAGLENASVSSLNLIEQDRWQSKTLSHWEIGAESAQKKLDDWLEHGLTGYKKLRDYPNLPHHSKLSPHLHFGEISPHQIWHAVQALPQDKDTDHFLSEIGWREFSYNLLFHNQQLDRENIQKKFDRLAWKTNPELLALWQRGNTGIPLVDAGMRQLWQTGFMHNRLRMVVGSFLVKNCLIDWREGFDWFWDCLFDADLANNAAGWQWIAGCGADAAPYFRIFNPISQSEKFDPNGEFIKTFVPELKALDPPHCFAPWLADKTTLSQANIVLGEDYPYPCIDLKASRQAALDTFKQTFS
ncbi:MAG: deoxyribodipyrimidine photolyase [Legionellales bacterium]|nr:deoxyribodipyrimidine photolyase [Legionellales bacterium]|tara:strand:+ start:633 stop:2051 length:1419 start_codon:yes stop_codon:yes gene_type:complete